MTTLIIGLGNPGKEYEKHRHNVGFMAVDALAEEYGFDSFSKKFHSEYSAGHIGRNKVILLKPQTYMNCSGIPSSECKSFYKIPLEKVIVIHDDLDLETGRLKVKKGGSDGGHNGLKSMDERIGKNYNRLRFGIGHPGHRDKVKSYVLSNFKSDETQAVEQSIESVVNHIKLLISGDSAKFLNQCALDNKKEKK